jgi:ankyrin repeat protein
MLTNKMRSTHIQDLPLSSREDVYKKCDVKSLLKFGQSNPKYILEILKVRDFGPLWFEVPIIGTCLWIVPMSKSFNVNTIDKYGRTALHEAANYGQPDCIKTYIDVGIKVNAVDKWKDTALHTACERGFLDIVEILLFKGADPNLVDKCGITPLSSISADKHTDDKKIETIMERLIKAKADPNIPSKHEETALHYACQIWKTDRIKMLIDAGADVNKATDEGLTPLHFVVGFDRYIPSSKIEDATECVRLLIEAGANVNAKDDQGVSVYKSASRNIKDIVLKYMDRKKVNKNVKEVTKHAS